MFNVLILAASALNHTWAVTKSGAYDQLPQHQTTYASFFNAGFDMLTASVERTLSTDDDILDPFQKLVHPIGICFAGTWTISEDSPYTGYFAKGKQGRIIVRASEALGNPDSGSYRSFGLAGKIYPTTNANDARELPTANFFTIDDLGGTTAAHFLDTGKTNEPATSFHASQLAIFPTLTKIAKSFAAADSNPGVRQVYEIAELGLADPAQAVTPYDFQLLSEDAQRVDATDFRDELRLSNYPNGLNFGIYVADAGSGWQRLGQIHLDDEALAFGCDHQLHFHHPRWK
jgi:hypothetical protein